MAFELKDNQGSLFKNSRKETEKHPDWNGTIKINGREFWISAWEKQGAKGMFYSLSLGQEKKPQGFTPRGEDELPKYDDLNDAPF
jgi:hypothetical protein